MRNILFAGVLAFFLYEYFVAHHEPQFSSSNPSGQASIPSVRQHADAREQHYVSGQEVHGQGVVIRILADDDDGSRHQRFILRLDSGQTLLIAHNIDLAARVAPLNVGDTVEFLGEYEANAKGGVVHWTHRDPQGHHQAGWLKHDGKTFQ